ncbi:MAG TPA: ATP-binding protein, partial [Actinomycetota bacterium]|nr:ATP-binding protein [Actinomycetota bacterium]
SVRAAAETLASLVDDPQASKHFAEQLLKDAERLSQIVTDLLDLSRLESEQPNLERIPLDSVAREEAGRLGDTAAKAEVEVRVATEEVLVDGSMKDLSLAIRNLLENAIQYTRPPGTVNIKVFQDNGQAVVSVSDSGIGIPSKDLPRIFERFYRVDRARSRHTGGTGLGLALVKHVAEQHGGRVEVESELGSGSTFRLILPLQP